MARDLQLKKSLDGVERWFDEKGPGGQSFRESLASGLTKRALWLLIQDKCPKPHGRPIPLQTIADVLDAMAHLHEHLETPKGASR